MRVAIDLSPLGPALPLGVARVIDEVSRAVEASGDAELVRLSPPPGAREGARRAAWRQLALPREAVQRGADVIHCFVSSFPLRARVPVVATVHELPWRRGEPENAGLAHRAWARLAARRASAVVCPSEPVARDLGAPRARVIPWGVGAVFRAGAPERPDDDHERSELRARLGLGADPYVLAPGGARAKKRLDLLCAAQRVAQAPWQIVVTGDVGLESYAWVEAATQDARAVFTGALADTALARLYRDAGATVALARSEGFALPVLEALACGCPVIVPRGSAQAEVSGGFAREVEPDDPRALAAALDAAVRARRGPHDAAELDLNARSFAAAHTWERAASALVTLWRGL